VTLQSEFLHGIWCGKTTGMMKATKWCENEMLTFIVSTWFLLLIDFVHKNAVRGLPSGEWKCDKLTSVGDYGLRVHVKHARCRCQLLAGSRIAASRCVCDTYSGTGCCCCGCWWSRRRCKYLSVGRVVTATRSSRVVRASFRVASPRCCRLQNTS